MLPVGDQDMVELHPGHSPAFPASERPQTNILDRATTTICTFGYIGFCFASADCIGQMNK